MRQETLYPIGLSLLKTVEPVKIDRCDVATIQY